MKRILLVVAVVALYALHQDFWFWRTAHPLVFGFVPIGLFYQAFRFPAHTGVVTVGNFAARGNAR